MGENNEKKNFYDVILKIILISTFLLIIPSGFYGFDNSIFVYITLFLLGLVFIIRFLKFRKHENSSLIVGVVICLSALYRIIQNLFF